MTTTRQPDVRDGPVFQPPFKTVISTRRLAAALAYDAQFIRSDGIDMRNLPMVEHPITGTMHYDHSFWPTEGS